MKVTIEDLVGTTEQPGLLQEANLPERIERYFLSNPHLLYRVLESLSGIDFDTMEMSRGFVFLLVADRSRSVKRFRDALVKCYQGMIAELKAIKTTGTLFGGCIAVTDEAEGGEVILPVTPVGAIQIDDNFSFVPNGGTPLHDTMVVAMVALVILVVLGKRNGVTLLAMLYLISDGRDEYSHIFNAGDVAEMAGLITGGRKKHRFGAVGVGSPLETVFTEMGVHRDAIRQVDATDQGLKAVFTEMSQSVTSVSQGNNAGGF